MTRRATKAANKAAAAEISSPMGCDAQPVTGIDWVKPETLHANDYNPNHVAPAEMALLKLSIMEDGWTQPTVARPDGEIVDGFHRWTLGSSDAEVQGLTGGLVPVVRLRPSDAAHQRMSTIRHNRARGTHAVVRMSDIVRSIVEQGVTEEEVMRRLGMEPEEVDRLTDTGGMTKRGAKEAFNAGWVPAGSDAKVPE